MYNILSINTKIEYATKMRHLGTLQKMVQLLYETLWLFSEVKKRGSL
jgi:hypothetical protein